MKLSKELYDLAEDVMLKHQSAVGEPGSSCGLEQALEVVLAKITELRREHPYGGHFVAWERCLFRRHTHVGKYRISTIGDFRPHMQYSKLGTAEPLSKDMYFETFVLTNGEEEEGIRYTTSAEAEAGHEAMIEKYMKLALIESIPA